MFINFSNHPSEIWSQKQREAAQVYGDIVDVAFPNVRPDADEVEIQHLGEKCVREILNEKPDRVMCQGEFTLCYYVVNRLKQEGIICVAACSERQVKEILEEGNYRKVVGYEFVGFREYSI